MGDEAATGTLLLVFGLELVVLYAGGSFAMGRLMAISGSGGGIAPRRIAFFVLVFPGVVLHEGAHYLACLLTGTKVSRFAAFSPRSRSADGRLVLGYVRHERRAFPIGVVIGLAPVLLNPLGILLVTALLTPLSLSEAADPSLATFEEGLSSGFVAGAPLLAAGWAYLSLSLALGSVPSREDLSGLPAVLLIFVVGVLLLGVFGPGSVGVLSPAVHHLAALAAGLYALPAAVALVAALLTSTWR